VQPPARTIGLDLGGAEAALASAGAYRCRQLNPIEREHEDVTTAARHVLA
jgi:hypothetical protein